MRAEPREEKAAGQQAVTFSMAHARLTDSLLPVHSVGTVPVNNTSLYDIEVLRRHRGINESLVTISRLQNTYGLFTLQSNKQFANELTKPDWR